MDKFEKDLSKALNKSVDGAAGGYSHKKNTALKRRNSLIGLALALFFIVTPLAAGSTAGLFRSPQQEGVVAFRNYGELNAYVKNNIDGGLWSFGNLFGGQRISLTGDSFTAESSIAASDSANKAGSHSNTNVQTVGVDESDTVKTDGIYIYTVGNGRLYIIDKDDLSTAAEYGEDGFYASEMYLYKKFVVLIGSEYTYIDTIWGGYWENKTTIRILDIASLTDIKPVRSISFPHGYVVASRMKDGYCYVALNNYHFYDGNNVDIPCYYDSAKGDKRINLPAKNIYMVPHNESFSYLVLAGFSIEDDSLFETKAYLGTVSTVYVSNENFYALVYSSETWVWGNEFKQYLYVMRFEIAKEQLKYKAIGKVEGYALNQFSMDEYGGTLRVALTIGWGKDNVLYILDMDMKVIGKLDGLGKPGERIYSVRYNGERAYVVTFMQIDPLYVIDIKDPKKPKVLGELEIAGFSGYLHIISDSLLLGVGIDGSRVKVDLYNVADPKGIIYEQYISDYYGYSSGVCNHKDITFYNDSATGELYMCLSEYGYGYWYGEYYGRLNLFVIGEDGTLCLLKQFETKYHNNRGVFIDDNIYILSNDYYSNYCINAFDLRDGLSPMYDGYVKYL